MVSIGQTSNNNVAFAGKVRFEMPEKLDIGKEVRKLTAPQADEFLKGNDYLESPELEGKLKKLQPNKDLVCQLGKDEKGKLDYQVFLVNEDDKVRDANGEDTPPHVHFEPAAGTNDCCVAKTAKQLQQDVEKMLTTPVVEVPQSKLLDKLSKLFGK